MTIRGLLYVIAGLVFVLVSGTVGVLRAASDTGREHRAEVGRLESEVERLEDQVEEVHTDWSNAETRVESCLEALDAGEAMQLAFLNQLEFSLETIDFLLNVDAVTPSVSFEEEWNQLGSVATAAIDAYWPRVETCRLV